MNDTKRSWILPCLLFTTIAQLACASIKGPYTPDANTVVLLHLDEPSTSGIADNTSTLPEGRDFIATAQPSAVATRIPTAGILGAVGASGVGFDFGRCANLSFSNSMGLYMDGNGNGIADLDNGTAGGDQISMAQIAGPSGEFTLEALVNLPSLTGANREIICMDGSVSPRPFQFRITSTGQIEFNNIGTAGANPKVSIPTTGPDAFVPNQWFHVALTYNGSGRINIYWTRLDNTRTGASLLLAFDSPALDESGSAVLTVGNENRSTSGEGLMGYIDEVRISNVARGATEMIFDTSAPPVPPSINPQPEDLALGVGETLRIQSHASGSPVLTYVWQKNSGSGFTNIPSQAQEDLSLPVTFDTAGQYRYIVSNSFGSVTSSVATVSVGGLFRALFRTGFDDQDVILEDGIVDPHYTLWNSPDPVTLGPDVIALPVTDNTYNANDENSRWLSPYAALGGVRGVFTYRTTFLLDAALPEGAALTASILSAGPTTVLLNGATTGVANLAPPFPGPYRNLFTFTLTNGFQPGVNTLDFVVDNSTTAVNPVYGTAIRVTSIRGVGPAVVPGVPAIQVEPGDKTVRHGGRATLSVVPVGRPPLRYHWYDADLGNAITGATNWALSFNPVVAGGQPERVKAVISNDSGSVTSRIASITVVPDNQAPSVASTELVAFDGQPANLSISGLFQKASDPDADTMTFGPFDATSTNALAYGSNNVAQNGENLQYYPVSGYVGPDEFNYGITDSQGATAMGVVRVLALNSPLNQTVMPGGTANFGVGLSAPPTGYTFQWQRNQLDLPSQTNGQLTVANAQLANAGAYTLVVSGPGGQKWTSPIAGLTVGNVGNGTGLLGNYFNSVNGTTNFQGPPIVTRVDPEINFDWNGTQPDPAVNATDFMVRWHGQVQPLYDDLYTFSTATDDGARLWVDGQLLVNDWASHAVTTNTGTVALQAGQKYDIVFEYYQGTGASTSLLLWSSEHQAPQAIAASQLFPGTGLPRPDLTVTRSGQTNVVVNWAGTFDLLGSTNMSAWTPLATNSIGPRTFFIEGAPIRFFKLATPQ